MNTQFSILIPPFLRKLDQRWLVERPILWASKIHYVLFYGSLGIVLAYFLGQVYQIYYAAPPNMTERFVFASIPVFLGLLFWVYQVRKFLRPGASSSHVSEKAWKNAALFMVGVFFLTLIPTTYVISLHKRIQEVYTEKTYVKDLQAASIGFFWDEEYGKHHMKNAPGLEWVELYTYRDQLLTAKDWLEAGEETQLLWVNNFRAVYNKYSLEELEVPDEKLLTFFTCEANRAAGSLRSRPRDCLYSSELSSEWIMNSSYLWDLDHNIEAFSDIILYPLSEQMVLRLIFFLGSILVFFVFIWQNSPNKEFFASMAIYLALGIGITFLVVTLGRQLDLSNRFEIYLPTIILLVLHRLAVRISLSEGQRAGIRKGALILASVAIPLMVFFIPISLMEMGFFESANSNKELTLAILSISSAFISFYIWARYYGPRMTRIATQPTKK